MIDRPMTEADYRELAGALDDMVDFRELRTGRILKEIEVEVPVPVLTISIYLVWGVGILCAATVLLIFVHHRRWIADAFRAAGLPILLSGLLISLIGMVLGAYPRLLDNILNGMSRLISGPAYLLMMHGLSFAALGLLSIITGAIMNRRAY